MGGDFGNTAGIREQAPEWDRFAHWPALPARLALLALALLLIVSALVPLDRNTSPASTGEEIVAGVRSAGDADLMLYDRVVERIRKGENYYDFIVEEHRQDGYPVRPSVTVRLPALAYMNAWLGEQGQFAAVLGVAILLLCAWWQRIGEERQPGPARVMMVFSLLLCAPVALNPYYFVSHDMQAGMLMALSFALHKPGKWHASLAVAGLALAIRELALPFVFLMGAMAFWRRDWKEAAAWSALVTVFFAMLAVHSALVAQHILPGDTSSPSWLVMRGFAGGLSMIVRSSIFQNLPHWLAGPLVVLSLAGWAGWRSPAGVFGTLLYLGYGFAFMIAGRENNFYWGTLITPALFIGLPLAPRAVWSLSTAAFPAPAREVVPAK